MSAWQFVTPARLVAFVLGTVAATVYNPVSAALREQSKRLEIDLFGERPSGLRQSGSGFWVRQKTAEGQAIINATSSREQGALLGGVTVFAFDVSGRFRERIEAKSAELRSGHWRLEQARVHASGSPTRELDFYSLSTNLTRAPVRENFAPPETVSCWELPSYTTPAEQAGLGAPRRPFAYQLLVARPLLLVAMVMLGAAVSFPFF